MTKTTKTKITSLNDLPAIISAETNVCIPGHHLESASRTHWGLVRDEDDKVVRELTVVW